MAQKERENFYRNSTVIVDHGKESLAAVLENDLANTKLTFEDFINRHQHDIYHLCYNKSHCCQCPTGRFVPANKSRILHPGQLDFLLDTSGSPLNGHNPNTSKTSKHCCRTAKKSLSTSDLDITLLRCLLMNFAINCRTNYIIRQDIDDLVKCRNTLYGHAKEAKLTDPNYSKYKTDVEGTILRIARFCNIENEMKQKLNDASQRPLDESILLQYQNKLIEQSEYENNIEEKFDEVKQQLILHDERLHCRMDTMERKFGEIGHRKRNIIAHTEALLLEHSKDDTYIVTEDIKTCCDILEKYKALVIIAKAGGGKSKTSLQIVKMYQEKLYTPMVFVNDEILRNRDLINFDDQNIVIMEDLFGRSNIDINEDVHTGILDVLYSCLKIESCKSKLIISVRGNDVMIRKLIERHKLFEKEMFINLDKIKSLHINKLILSKHMNKHGISLCQCSPWLNIISVYGFYTSQPCESELFETNPNSFQVCVKLFNEICSGKYEMHIGFPQACHLFCSNSSFTKQGLEFFTRASQSLVNEINNLKNQGFDNTQIRYQYCTLVYTAIKSSLVIEDIDEHCFQHILSYFENKTIRMSLLKDAVRKLEGIYINERSSESAHSHAKRQKVSDIYVLQHNTIREAILLSYGEDADVLPFCDLVFLCEYIRPKGYKHFFGDQMVFIFSDYKHVALKLISMLSTDDITFTIVGCYLERVALLHRRDEIIEFFFKNLKNVEPKEYGCLLNGLTSLGTNPALIKFHPNLCKTIMIHAGMKVFNAFCRPIGWTKDDSNFVEIEKNLLMNKLYYIIDTSSLKESEKNKIGVLYYINCCHSNSSRYVVGKYVFENLIAKGFISIVECLFEKLKQNLQKIIPIYVKEFLDGLLDDNGKRSGIVSQFKEFFEAVLFKYGSIPTVLQLCIPSSSTIINPNLIKVDDRLLTGKLSAHLESSCEMELGLEARLPAVNREDGAYFVYWDNDYIKRKYINLMTEYLLKQGFQSNNEKFVRTMYEQFVSGRDGDEIVKDDSESRLDDGQNKDKVENDWAAKYTKVIFNEYPGDKIWVDEKGEIAYVIINNRFVKKVFKEKIPILYGDTMRARLFLFLKDLEPFLKAGLNPYSRRMTLLRIKFYSLFKNCSN